MNAPEAARNDREQDPDIVTLLAKHPVLGSWNLTFVRRWKTRHSELIEFAPTSAGVGFPIVVKRITRWKGIENAERALSNEFLGLANSRTALPSDWKESIPEAFFVRPDLKLIALQHMTGTSLAAHLKKFSNALSGFLLSNRAARIVEMTGAWLSTFQTSSEQPPAPFCPEIFLQDFHRRPDKFSLGGFAEPVEQALIQAATAAAMRLQNVAVLHCARQGDFIPQNILIHHGKICMLDFENYLDEDSAYEDVATFVAYLRLLQTSSWYSHKALLDMEQAFLAGYGRGLDRRLLDLYLLKAAVTIAREFPGAAAQESPGDRFHKIQQMLLSLAVELGSA
jgi:hypothetical protein